MKFLPGDLVVPNLHSGADTLLLWNDENGVGPNVVVAEIKRKSILTVIKCEHFKEVSNKNDEWANGACLLISSDGIAGWTGNGWLKKITT